MAGTLGDPCAHLHTMYMAGTHGGPVGTSGYYVNGWYPGRLTCLSAYHVHGWNTGRPVYTPAYCVPV